MTLTTTLGDVPQVIAQMPLITAAACVTGQTFVPPGGSMGPQYGNQITTTGACIDPIVSTGLPANVLTSVFSFPSTVLCPMLGGTCNWSGPGGTFGTFNITPLAIDAAVWGGLLFLLLGGRR